MDRWTDKFKYDMEIDQWMDGCSEKQGVKNNMVTTLAFMCSNETNLKTSIIRIYKK